MSDFTQVFRDDFNGSSLDYGIWKALYSGTYWNGMFRWDPAQLEVGDGKLTIATENGPDGWVSGGLSTIPDGQTYGSYEFRARFDAAQGTSGAILLWPSDGEWTDEVDIIELFDPSRQSFAFVNHGDPMTVEYVNVDATDWHTYRLDWTPGNLALSVDGQEVKRVTTDVPVQEMSFGMQAQVMGPNDTWFGGAPDGSTPDRVEIEVDWVEVSAWTPGQGTDPEPAPAPAAPVEEPPAAEAPAEEPPVAEVPAEEPPVAEAPAGEAPGEPVTDDYWLAAAERYLENDGTWEGSWRNQVEAGQMTLEDVAARIEAGEGEPSYWQDDTWLHADGPVDPEWLAAAEAYIAQDGEWDGSWRNQVEAGELRLEDVAVRLEAGLVPNFDLSMWQ